MHAVVASEKWRPCIFWTVHSCSFSASLFLLCQNSWGPARAMRCALLSEEPTASVWVPPGSVEMSPAAILRANCSGTGCALNTRHPTGWFAGVSLGIDPSAASQLLFSKYNFFPWKSCLTGWKGIFHSSVPAAAKPKPKAWLQLAKADPRHPWCLDPSFSPPASLPNRRGNSGSGPRAWLW